jgi:hypothetical protein
VLSRQSFGQLPNSAAISKAIDSLASTSSRTTPIAFSLADASVPPGGHIQGIQFRFDAHAKRHLAFISHDSQTVGYLVVVEFPEDLTREGRAIHVERFPSDGRQPPLRHAGGIQLVDDVLAVGLEDNQQKTRSEVQFWNVGIPTKPRQLSHLTVRRAGAPKEKTAGAVGLVKRGGDYLLAVANWDSRAIDFYVSSGKPLADRECHFEPKARWQVDQADKSQWRPDQEFAAYQAVNLFADAAGNAFLSGFASTPAGADVVDLFALELNDEPKSLLRKVYRKQMTLADDNHFRYGGGLWIHDGRLAVLASPRTFARSTRINLAARATPPSVTTPAGRR